ncbi:unnamed protein product [Strongylus vulgaris]|uniref:Protein kinase domain-containing protein n=1 Tax=Strongylus vulgaris TaxID=40348 RepID=A0A3P7J3L0_STRVU|nr:unnamed protein product [Strongylus vulgaris]
MDPHKRVPIRWLAPETLKMAIYTQKTDVFSYGIMCWEIYNNGIEPYPGMTVAEVNQNVKEGYRMELPMNVPPDVQNIIKVRCWSENPNDRYSMADIAKHLQRMLQIPRPDFAAIRAARMAAEAAQPANSGPAAGAAVTPGARRRVSGVPQRSLQRPDPRAVSPTYPPAAGGGFFRRGRSVKSATAPQQRRVDLLFSENNLVSVSEIMPKN